MRLWKHSRAPTPEPEANEHGWTRRAPVHCAGCKRASERYVYLRNGKDYCIPCALAIRASLGILPGGRRAEDITDLDSLMTD